MIEMVRVGRAGGARGKLRQQLDLAPHLFHVGDDHQFSVFVTPVGPIEFLPENDYVALGVGIFDHATE